MSALWRKAGCTDQQVISFTGVTECKFSFATQGSPEKPLKMLTVVNGMFDVWIEFCN